MEQKEKRCWVCGGIIGTGVAKKLGTPIDEMGLPTRAVNALHRNGIEYVEQILHFDMKSLLRLRNMGEKTAQEIREKLHALDFGWE